MSYRDRLSDPSVLQKQGIRTVKFAQLDKRRERIENLVQRWMDDATTLHAESTQDERPDVQDLRQDLIQGLRTRLGL